MSMSALAAASLARFFSASASSFLSRIPRGGRRRRLLPGRRSAPRARRRRETPRDRRLCLAFGRLARGNRPRVAWGVARSATMIVAMPSVARAALRAGARDRERERERDLLLPPSRRASATVPSDATGAARVVGAKASPDVTCRHRLAENFLQKPARSGGGGCGSRHRVHRASHPPAERTQTPAHLPRTSHRGSHRARDRARPVVGGVVARTPRRRRRASTSHPRRIYKKFSAAAAR